MVATNGSLEVTLASLIRERRFDQAIKVWQTSVADQRTPRAHVFAAASYAELDLLDDAWRTITPASSNEQAPMDVFWLAGRIAFDLAKYQDCVRLIEPTLANVGSRTTVWRIYLRAAIGINEPSRALARNASYGSLCETDADIALCHAELLAADEKPDDARLYFEYIVARFPANAHIVAARSVFIAREFPEHLNELVPAQNSAVSQFCTLTEPALRAANALPTIYDSDASAEIVRAKWISSIKELAIAAQNNSLAVAQRVSAVACLPFALAYHDADVTNAQFAWGDFLESVVKPLRDRLHQTERDSVSPRSIGIVSNRLNDSSAGRFFNPWIAELKRAGFVVRLYAVGPDDYVTSALRGQHELKHFGVDHLSRWQSLHDALVGDANDVLLFPEPQGSSLLQLIAALRCAPIQCAGYGNPLTTGTHAFDYFIAPAAAEAPDAQVNYRERLVTIDGMGVHIPMPTRLKPNAAIGLRLDQRFRYAMVSQQMQKWSPGFVDAIVQILKGDDLLKIVYFTYGSSGTSSIAFERMLTRRFSSHGIKAAERLIRAPLMQRDAFLALHHEVNLLLDTWPFSGASTTLDALSQGVPVLTYEGRFLRGRQSAGLLRLCEQSDWIATSKEQYVNLALSRIQSAQPYFQQLDGVLPNEKLRGEFASIGDFIASL
jgi:predicted O-linked N-acetylglucosamine transferase (SPINDLY family)